MTPKADRRWRRLGAAAGLALLAVFMGGPARADTTPSLGGYNVNADGNVVDILVDNTTGLAGIHPLSEADFPEAESSLATGPFGSGLATVFWPGSAAGDFGSLAPELGFPSQLQPLTSQLNDPVRASAQYPGGPPKATYPSGNTGGVAEMQSTADATGVTAAAALTDQQPAQTVFSFSHAKGTSAATANSKAVANSSTDITDVQLLGGLIDIGSITSTAQATSDGNASQGGSTTHISGVTVLGQPASIGSDGLVLPNFASALGPITGPIVQNALSQTISGLGLVISEFPGTQTHNGASFTTASGGVARAITPPSSAAPILEQAGQALAPLFPSQAAIIPTLPGLLQGFTTTITIGRSTATAAASPPFSDTFNAGSFPIASVGGTATGSAPLVAGTSGAGTSIPASGGASFASTGTGGPSTGTGSAGSTGTSLSPGPTGLISVSSPVGAGAVAFGVIIAALAGFGLWRVARMLLPQDAAPVCPLGQDNP